MNIPEKEFLSKKKCIYEAIFFPDGRISIERRAIAYLNRSNIYIIVPGSNYLKLVTYNWLHDSTDTETIPSNLTLAAHRHCRCITYFWDRPDISDKHIIEAKKSYWQNRKNNLLEKIDEIERKCEIKCGQYKKEIENCMKQLEKIERENLNER